jgi:hypothetical protein
MNLDDSSVSVVFTSQACITLRAICSEKVYELTN